MGNNLKLKFNVHEVIDYYNHTDQDFRFLWLHNDYRSNHCGYNDETTKSHSDEITNMNKVLARKVAIKPGEVVLDAGCGNGNSCFWLAKNLQATVYGITPVFTEINDAEKKLNCFPDLKEKIFFQQKDYTKTGYKDESFDVVWACESIAHTPKKSKFYEEAFRILKPGGRLVLTDFIRRSRHNSEQQETLLSEWTDGWAIPDLDTSNEHKANLERNGFIHIRMEDHTKNTLPSLLHLYKFAKNFFPLESLMKELHLRSACQHRNVLGAIKQYEALKQNLWFYGIITAYKK